MANLPLLQDISTEVDTTVDIYCTTVLCTPLDNITSSVPMIYILMFVLSDRKHPESDRDRTSSKNIVFLLSIIEFMFLTSSPLRQTYYVRQAAT
jgi:hypothetical protein